VRRLRDICSKSEKFAKQNLCFELGDGVSFIKVTKASKISFSAALPNEISGGSTPTSTNLGVSKTIKQNSQFSAKTIISENFGNDHRSFPHRSVPTVSARYLRPETKTVQIVATSAEHAVFFDRLGTNGSQKNSAKVTGCILYNRISVQRRAKLRYSN